jgi:hypothetical protein
MDPESAATDVVLVVHERGSFAMSAMLFLGLYAVILCIVWIITCARMFAEDRLLALVNFQQAILDNIDAMPPRTPTTYSSFDARCAA